MCAVCPSTLHGHGVSVCIVGWSEPVESLFCTALESSCRVVAVPVVACLHLIPEFLISVVTVTGFQRGFGYVSLLSSQVAVRRLLWILLPRMSITELAAAHVRHSEFQLQIGGRSGEICSSKARRAIAAGLSAAQREQLDGAPSSCGFHLGTAAASLIGCVSECGIFCPRDVSGSYGHDLHALAALRSCTAMRVDAAHRVALGGGSGSWQWSRKMSLETLSQQSFA